MRGRKKKDGTYYPTYYGYACRPKPHLNRITCGYGQISSTLVDNAMKGIITSIVNGKNFGDVMSELIGDHLSTEDIDKELDTATKAYNVITFVGQSL